MLIDLHTHTRKLSWDSSLDASDLIERCRALGLDGICLSEHDFFWDDGAAQALADRHGFLVVPAVEINTETGHVLCFGLSGYVYGMHRWPELAEHVQRAGGAMVAAHPHRRRMPHQAKDPTGYAEALDRACDDPFYQACAALETGNGRCNEVQNAFAHDLAQRLGRPATAGSDAHDPQDIGVCATEFDDRITGLRDLIDALHGGRFRPRWLARRA